MSKIVSNTYESLWEIIEFYRVQPKVKELQLEKIEEYLVVMNAHYQKSMTEIDELIDEDDAVDLADVIDVLNSYLSLIAEELKKIFPEEENTIFPIDVLSDSSINEIQVIELFRSFNAGDSNFYRINEALDSLDTMVYEERFGRELVLLTKILITRISADVIVRVDDLI